MGRFGRILRGLTLAAFMVAVVVFVALRVVSSDLLPLEWRAAIKQTISSTLHQTDQLRQTAVARMETESSERKLAPDLRSMVEWRTYRVTLRRPLEPNEIDTLADTLRAECPSCFGLSFRFVLTGWPRVHLDPEVSQMHYAWKHFQSGEKPVTSFVGVSPGQMLKLLQTLKLRDGEQLVGAWIDHYSPVGAVALVRSGASLEYLRLADPDRRWALRPAQRAGLSEYYVAAYVENLATGQRFLADGAGTDPLAISIEPLSRALSEYDRLGPTSPPWLHAKSLMPSDTAR